MSPLPSTLVVRPGEKEISRTLRLAVPLILAELGWMAMGVVDTMIVGRLGAVAIGAIGLGGMLFYGVAICAAGVLLGLDTLISRAWGAGDARDARHSLVNGLWLAAFLVPVVMALVWACEPMLVVFGIDPAVRSEAVPYLRALRWSAPPLLVYFALRRYLQAVSAARPVMMALITANVVNAVGAWALVFGAWGAPQLGSEGAGWATCISRVYMAGFLAAVVWGRKNRFAELPWRPDFRRIGVLLRLGLPAAGQMVVEIGVFATVTVLVGKLNALTLAAHQITLVVVSATFMMPLGISSAAAVRVGHELGRGDPRAASRAGWTSLALGAGVMGAAAVALLAAPHWIARLFTPETAVIGASAALLRIAAFFQLFDGLQIVATGALRGAGNTHTPMIWHFAGYWIIGLPIGAVLCFAWEWGAAGLWIGLSLGLILIGTVLALVWRNLSRRFTGDR